MKKTCIIVQARMTSTRLLGKVLLPLEDKTVLGHVLSRCQAVKGIDTVCCAIPATKEHEVLIPEIKKYDAVIFKGSELNVLERYYQAARFLDADIIMRITSDCPLINPEVCSQTLKLHVESNSEYTCNNMPPTWPHGYDCEVFNFDGLEKAVNNADQPEDFEHVSPWMRRNLKVINLKNPKGNQYHIRITLDTLEDYKHIKEIVEGREASTLPL